VDEENQQKNPTTTTTTTTKTKRAQTMLKKSKSYNIQFDKFCLGSIFVPNLQKIQGNYKRCSFSRKLLYFRNHVQKIEKKKKSVIVVVTFKISIPL
jgi:hypothetical protein